MTTPPFDHQLQKRLDLLWFRLPDALTRQQLGIKDAELGIRQRWLLRIFQSCAREEFGARDETAAPTVDAERLRQVRLVGPARLGADSVPHGVADQDTLAAIDAWCADANRLRCPLIFQARSKTSPADTQWSNIVAQGFSFHDELRDRRARVFARDFTGRYALLADGKPPRVTMGTAISWGTGKTPRWGIKAGAAHSLDGVGRFDPEHVTGKSWAQLSLNERANFRVIAALASVEADGVLDGINAYDSSVLSAGPYHFTAFPAAALGAAELGAFLAYWGSRRPVDYESLRDSTGVGAIEPWSRSLREESRRVYNAQIGYVNDDGELVAPSLIAERDYVRTYYMFYRLQFAMRSFPSMRLATWPYARQRLADVATAEWASGAPPGARTLGDVFKSELSMAMLLRWHVFRPRHVVFHGKAGVVPAQLVEKAKLKNKPISSWNDNDDAALVHAFLTAKVGPLKGMTAKRLRDTLSRLSSWSQPEWAPAGASEQLGTLQRTRNFTTDVDDIPFPA